MKQMMCSGFAFRIGRRQAPAGKRAIRQFCAYNSVGCWQIYLKSRLRKEVVSYTKRMSRERVQKNFVHLTMSRLRLVVIVLAAFHTAVAQLTVRSITWRDGTPEAKFAFPFIQQPNRQVADRINTLLQQDVLWNDRIETDPNRIFEAGR